MSRDFELGRVDLYRANLFIFSTLVKVFIILLTVIGALLLLVDHRLRKLIITDKYTWLLLYLIIADVRDALVGVGLILNENGNYNFDKGLSVWV